MDASPSLAPPGANRRALVRLFEERDVATLARWLFRHDLAPGQVEIVRALAFREHPRVAIAAYTRYGKTFAVADGVCLRFLIERKPRKTAWVSATNRQSLVGREYVVDNVLACPLLLEQLDLDVQSRGVERLRKEISRERLTFKDGHELVMFSAQGGGERLMAHGAHDVVEDEAGLIDDETHRTKVARMVGDDPTGGTMVKLGNPWARGTHFHHSFEDPAWRAIRIDWRQGVREGRTTAAFIEEQRRTLAPTEFQILYEAVFPDVAESQLIPWAHIERAATAPRFWGPAPADGVRTEYSLDVAEEGSDDTVLTRLRTDGVRRQADRQWTWHLADTTVTAQRVLDEAGAGATVAVDTIGPGKGVADQLRAHGVRIVSVRVSERPTRDPGRFKNLKADLFWALREAFEADAWRIPDDPALRDELTRYRFDRAAGKIHVYEEGGDSPDHGDSLAYAHAIRGAAIDPIPVGAKPAAFSPRAVLRL